MNEQRPMLDPNSESAFEEAETMELTVPAELPPQMPSAAAEDNDFIPEASEALGDAAPSLPVEGASIASGITAWQNNKRITALWSIDQNRNAWVGVQGLGWKKLSNSSDQGVVALNMLSAHAREKNSPVNLLEDKGMIRQMYVW